MSEEYIKKAEISSENGGILVYYKEGFRENVIKLVSKINVWDLEIIPADSEYGITEIDREFRDSILEMTAKKSFQNCLFQCPCGNILSFSVLPAALLPGALTVVDFELPPPELPPDEPPDPEPPLGKTRRRRTQSLASSPPPLLTPSTSNAPGVAR